MSNSVPIHSSRRASWRTRLPFFYGWVIVGSVFLTYAFSYGAWYSFSVFYVALLGEFGWGRAATAGAFSLFATIVGVGGILGGYLLDRFGPAKVMPAGGILLAAGLAATSRVTQLWEFYLYFGVVCGLSLALTGWVNGIAVVSRWFSGRQGMAVGIAAAGIGLGTVVMAPFSQYLISTAGWRPAYLVMAVIALVGIVPQTALLQVGHPEELGLKPDGGHSGAGAARRTRREVRVVDPEWAGRPWSVTTAARTARFWLITATLSLAILAQQMLFAHHAAFLVDGGYDRMVAASVVGAVGFLSMFAKTILGEAGDRLGRERAFTVGSGFALLAVALLVATRINTSVWMAFLYAAAFSIGYAATPAIVSTATADLFAGRNFGAIYGVICLGQGLGAAFGAWVAGYIYDSTGSYMAAFAVAIVCIILSVACLWLSAPRLVRRLTRPS